MAVPSAHLIEMPLHAITESLGEEGLRARFILEIGRFDPLDRARLTSALGLASDLHRDDMRVREPYVNHLLRVAARMTSHYQVRDPEVIVAGLLHDAVEDHGPELAEAVPAAGHLAPGVVPRALITIGSQFGTRVAELVSAVTNPEYLPDRDPDLQYLEHVTRSLDNSPWARVIKVSDFTDNGVGVIHTTGPKVIRAASKYRPLVPILRELVGRPDTPLSRWVKRHIFDQLDLAEERFRDILDRDPPGGRWVAPRPTSASR